MADFLFDSNSTDVFGDNNYYDSTTNEYTGSVISHGENDSTIFDSNHQVVGTQTSNIFGGSNIQMANGQNAQTMSNIQGGEDLFINGEKVGHTQPNIFGGTNTYDSSGNLSSTTYSNVFGGKSKF